MWPDETNDCNMLHQNRLDSRLNPMDTFKTLAGCCAANRTRGLNLSRAGNWRDNNTLHTEPRANVAVITLELFS